MNESVFENSMFTDDKSYKISIHSERDNWLQTSALADSTEIRYTENKQIVLIYCIFFLWTE